MNFRRTLGARTLTHDRVTNLAGDKKLSEYVMRPAGNRTYRLERERLWTKLVEWAFSERESLKNKP